MSAKYEEKYIVIKVKDLKKLTDKQVSTLSYLHDKIGNKNKYYVCNQDEPYADNIINTILEGESKKGGAE